MFLLKGTLTTFADEKAVRAAFKGQSLASPLTSFDLEQLNIVRYSVAPKPNYDPDTQSVIEGMIEEVDGQWVQYWEILDEPEEVIEPEYKRLSKVSFMDHAVSSLGSNLTGITRYGEVIKAARESVNPAVITAMERYQHAQVIEQEDCKTFLDILVNDTGIPISEDERNIIIDNWPTN